jgi:hypothetical protein
MLWITTSGITYHAALASKVTRGGAAADTALKATAPFGPALSRIRSPVTSVIRWSDCGAAGVAIAARFAAAGDAPAITATAAEPNSAARDRI